MPHIQNECCVSFSEGNIFAPPTFITAEKLKSLTGIEFYKVSSGTLQGKFW